MLKGKRTPWLVQKEKCVVPRSIRGAGWELVDWDGSVHDRTWKKKCGVFFWRVSSTLFFWGVLFQGWMAKRNWSINRLSRWHSKTKILRQAIRRWVGQGLASGATYILNYNDDIDVMSLWRISGPASKVETMPPEQSDQPFNRVVNERDLAIDR